MTKQAISGSILAALLIILAACSNKPTYDCFCPNITHYKVRPNTTTPKGINVDTSEMEIELAILDQETSALEQCLGITIDRPSVVVKIAPDWRISPCTGAELFPCSLEPSVCFGSQPQPDPECPCACGGAVQPPNVIVLTPNLAAYRHELIHLVTRANHGDPRFAQCENPSSKR